jgi:hypothetical protein
MRRKLRRRSRMSTRRRFAVILSLASICTLFADFVATQLQNQREELEQLKQSISTFEALVSPEELQKLHEQKVSSRNVAAYSGVHVVCLR